jgi:hypothetical protein
METDMNYPINHNTLGTGKMLPDEIDPAFDPAEDDYLDCCLFESREFADFRNHQAGGQL